MKPIPVAQRFYLRDVGELADEIARLGLALPKPDVLSSDLGTALALPGGAVFPHRFCACLQTGHDASPDGAPSKMTYDRYARYAAGGYGVLVSEPVACHVNQRRTARQIHLGRKPDPGLGSLMGCVRAAATQAAVSMPLCFLQLDASVFALHRKSPEYCQKLMEAVVEAGWHGVELVVDANRGELVGALLGWLREMFPALVRTVRLCVYDGHPGGFGADAVDYRVPDPTQLIALLQAWSGQGLTMLHMQMTYPPRMQHDAQTVWAIPENHLPQEHPLVAVARCHRVAAAIKRALPDLVLMTGGFSWLRDLMPAFVGPWIGAGDLDVVGLGRYALAYPDAPQQWLGMRQLDRWRCCTQCGACLELEKQGAPVGCVLQDPGVYGSIFRFHQRYQPEHIQFEAQRCHQCAPAPCTIVTPGQLDIPAIMRAVAAGDLQRAGKLLRKQQHLAEMCALLSPYSASGESRCIETILSCQAVAIRDVQYQAAVYARDQALVKIPAEASGHTVVIVGGGPAGLAAAAALLEAGNHITLLERGTELGGVPSRLIPEDRFGGNQEEIAVMFRDALQSGRLRVNLQTDVGGAEVLRQLHADADAVLLATGLWTDRPVISGAMPPGVYGGLAFLGGMKAGSLDVRPARAAVFAGGDCAMDTAVILKQIGVRQIYLLYGGGRAEMPWCLDESWFAQPGVALLTWCQPIEYLLDANDNLCGVRVQHRDPGGGGNAAMLTLQVDLVVDASGLIGDPVIGTTWPEFGLGRNGCLVEAMPGSYATAYPGLFAVGAIRNGGASVPQCVQEGMEAGREIADWLKKERA